MTRRGPSRKTIKKMSRLADLARLRAHLMDHRLAPKLQRVKATEARIAETGERRVALLASQSAPLDTAQSLDAENLTMHAYMHIQADALRLQQAAHYRELARAEADAAPLRADARRAQAQVKALERLAAQRPK
jgi:hypothetical protein